MRFVLLAASLVLFTGCAATEPVDVASSPGEDPGTTSEVSCIPGEELVLDASDTLYIVSGSCDAVSVVGSGLVVHLEAVGDLVVTGDDNVIDALSVETLEIVGSDNVVSSGSEVGHIAVSGDGNDVRKK